jgi:L-asparagine permease
LCQLRLFRLAKAGVIVRPKFQMPLTPYSSYATLAFLAGVLVLMIVDEERGPWIIVTLIFGIPTLVGGWFLVRKRVLATAEEAGSSADEAPAPAAAMSPVDGRPGDDVPVAGDPVIDPDDRPTGSIPLT